MILWVYLFCRRSTGAVTHQKHMSGWLPPNEIPRTADTGSFQSDPSLESPRVSCVGLGATDDHCPEPLFHYRLETGDFLVLSFILPLLHYGRERQFRDAVVLIGMGRPLAGEGSCWTEVVRLGNWPPQDLWPGDEGSAARGAPMTALGTWISGGGV